MKFFTIGYGAFAGKGMKETFAGALKKNKVRTIVDVRLEPKSPLGLFTRAKKPDKGIEAYLASNQIRYIWVKALGNHWMGRKGWDAKYKAYVLKAAKDFVRWFEDLDQPFCLMCGESDPSDCHRLILAERLAKITGWKFENIER